MKITSIFEDITNINYKYKHKNEPFIRSFLLMWNRIHLRRLHDPLGMCGIWWQINLTGSPVAYKANPALMSGKVTNFRQIGINSTSCCRFVLCILMILTAKVMDSSHWKHTTTLFSLSDHDILCREWGVIVHQVQSNYRPRPFSKQRMFLGLYPIHQLGSYTCSTMRIKLIKGDFFTVYIATSQHTQTS